MKTTWTQAEAIALCVALEQIAPKFGGHVALTGGCLYKTGERKDVDIMCYRSLDEPPFNWDGFFEAINVVLGVQRLEDFGWCKKARIGERSIDFFDPFSEGNYPQDATTGLLLPQSDTEEVLF